MLLPQLLLAALCVALGVFPAFAAHAFAAVLARSPGGLGASLAGVPLTAAGQVTGLEALGGAAVLRPVVVLVVLGLLLVLARAIGRLGGAPRRAVTPWLCGYAEDGELHRARAHDLYGEVKGALGALGGVPRPPARPRGKGG